ncbi:YgaP family membrane protein [Arenibaculum pallidiluteum]|uniref:YgaP family membrane protein n=1 Tax=Arenibaculum pallidiluteum TaxID=2812559 RepID=UPI001F1DC9BD|nr:DUF2892 domain-containing protein [Arenibaculum pallidiluteum]
MARVYEAPAAQGGHPPDGASSRDGESGASPRGEEALNQAFERIEDQVPDRVSRLIGWLRKPEGRWVRMPLGVVLIIGSVLSILPVFGLWMLPVGLMLLAVDIPFLQGPVGRSILWLERHWKRLRERWLNRS